MASTFLGVFYIQETFSLHTVAFSSLKQNHMDRHLHNKKNNFGKGPKSMAMRLGSAFS